MPDGTHVEMEMISKSNNKSQVKLKVGACHIHVNTKFPVKRSGCEQKKNRVCNFIYSIKVGMGTSLYIFD